MKLADGYEDAFVGTTISAFSRKQVAVYDYDKCLLILINKYGLDDETAMEWFSQCSNVSYKCVIFKQNDIQEYNDTYFKPYNLNTKHILLMPAADSRVDLQELEKDVVEWCKDYGYRYSSRLHIQLWDKKTGV